MKTYTQFFEDLDRLKARARQLRDRQREAMERRSNALAAYHQKKHDERKLRQTIRQETQSEQISMAAAGTSPERHRTGVRTRLNQRERMEADTRRQSLKAIYSRPMDS